MKTGYTLLPLLLLLSTAQAAPTALRQTHLPESTSKTPYRVVVFVSARCPCSGSHESSLRALQKDFSTQGFDFVGIHANSDEPKTESDAHFAKAKLGFPIIEDSQGRWTEALGALKTPHAYVVDAQGNVFYEGGVTSQHDAGTGSEPYLRKALEAIAQGKTPERAQTRTIGCIIRRSGT